MARPSPRRPRDAKKPLARLTGHVQLINHCAFSADGHWLASASFDGAVRFWDVGPDSGPVGALLFELDGGSGGHAHNVNTMAFDSVGATLYSGDAGGIVRGGARGPPC